jgi:predicted HTH domain antitoxin
MVNSEAIVCDAYKIYAMGTISARVPDELEAELDAYLEDENLDRSTAVRKLLSEGLEQWRRERALEQLAAGSISFSKAAELAGMSVWDFAQLAKERDITWVDDDHLDADLEAL